MKQSHSAMKSWSVLLVEPCEIYRIGVEEALLAAPTLVVSSSCGSADQAKESAVLHRPDVVVVGLAVDGPYFQVLELLKWFRITMPLTAVVVMLEGYDPDSMNRILRMGVRGLIRRDSTAEVLMGAILRGLAGKVEVDPSLSAMMLDYVMSTEARMPLDCRTLTDREAQVLDLYACGIPTARIAIQLGLAQRTVNSHLENVQRKLGLSSSRDLLVKAVKWRCVRREFSATSNEPACAAA
jgi:DNA-binding NarL/FixJ family response regulator